MIAPSRPLSGLQPATHTVAGFRYAVLQAAPASTKHTSATAARRSPFPYARRPRSRLGIPARLGRSGGRRRFALAASRFLRRASLLLRAACVRSASARLHPRPERRRRVPAASPAASRCSRCSRLSLSASDNASPTQAGLVQTNIASMSIGVARPGCVPCRTGSRLGFFRHFLLPGEQPPPPSVGTGRCRGAPRLNTFLPIPAPIRQ